MLMKILALAVVFMLHFCGVVFTQPNITIHGGGAVTVNGDTYIVPTTFTCGSPFVDSRDGHVYNTVQIGVQCWMAQNLNAGTRIHGSVNQTNNGVLEKYCFFNDENNCSEYGGLYQWNEAMQYSTTPGVQGICPNGWHLASDAEWCTLTQYIDPTVNCNMTGWSGTDAALRMKSTTGWFNNGNNSSGFTALPGGYRESAGDFLDIYYNSSYWASSQFDASIAWSIIIHDDSGAEVGRMNFYKAYGFSVRCLQD
jgi:uncharacterized protein (TIGR02145 family)